MAHVIQARYSPAGESTLCAMPMYHTMGLRSLVSMVLIGGTTAFLPSFSPDAALTTIEREQLSALYLVPTAFWALLQESGATDGCASVRKLAYAGAAMTESLTTQLVEALRPEVFINHYGSTEVYTFAVESDAIARPGSAGRPGLFTRLRLVAADPERRVGPDEQVSPGETGEIIASLASDEAFAGYWQRPDANERALRDGWYFTGDLGNIDDEGNLRVSGRIDDMVISGGENVHPLEVEDAIARCDSVDEVAVAGVPDDKWGHAVTAFVVVAGRGVRGRRRPADRRVDAGAEWPGRIQAPEADRHPRRAAQEPGRQDPAPRARRRQLRGARRGDALMATVAQQRRVGTTVERLEDAALLVGRGRFMDDIDPVPGTLEAAIVRSPHPHARIVGFDASQAAKAPGVRCVLGPEQTAALRPFPLTLKAPMPYRPAATDRVRYVGEPVAVVVAESRHLAEDAAELVDVQYETLPAVVDVRDAMTGDAPRLHDEADSNVATDRSLAYGDVDGAFAAAAHVVEGEFGFPRYSSTPIETYGVIANWERDGTGDHLTAWCNFHGPFTMQPVIAGALGLSPARVRLIVPEDIGGSFGIKSGVYAYVALMALASREAGAPVRWIEDRVEHLLASSAGNDREMAFAAAVDDDGTRPRAAAPT